MCKLNRIMIIFMVIACVLANLSIPSNAFQVSKNSASVPQVLASTLKVDVPIATPGAGTVVVGTRITLSTATTDAAIYYTLNGNTPTANSNRYSSPITINTPRTIKAIAVKRGMTNSDVLTSSYTILPKEKAATPVAAPSQGAVVQGTKVTLSTTTTEAAIYYTLNGNTPTTSSNRYSTPITINAPKTIKAIAVKKGMTNSNVLSAAYTLLPKEIVATPIAAPSQGAVLAGTLVTLSTTTSDATIYYTLNGNTPTTYSNRYTNPITINTPKTIKAIAVKQGMTNSSILTATYTIGTPSVTKYTLTVEKEGNGVTYPVSGSYQYDENTLVNLSATAAEGYSFVKWIIDGVDVLSSTSSVTMTSNKAVKAVFAPLPPPVVAVNGVTLDRTTLSLVKGASAALVTTIQPANATNQNIVWSSSDNAIATVVNGLVTAVNQGTATITVTTVDGSKTANCTVTVNPDARTILDVQPSKDIAAPLGIVASSIGLPQVVKVILDDNTIFDIPVTWNTTTYNKDVLGTYTLSGNLTSLPDFITNPNSKTASIKITVVIPNSDPNPNTTMNLSTGNTLVEFDSLNELNVSTSAKVDLDQGNVISGTAAGRITSLSPLPAGGTESYISVQTKEILGDKLKDINNIEFNLYIPDKTQVDYILVNFYTNTWHSTFYQADIGTWELTPGWNKIRRSLADIKWIDSTVAVSNAATALTSNSIESQKIVDHKKKVNQFNTQFFSKIKSSITESAAVDAETSYWNTVDNIEFFIAFKTGSTPSITFDRVSYNIMGKAKILFTFDDSWYDVMKYGYPILREEGQKATNQEEGFKATLWANMLDSQANNTDRNPSQEAMWILNESELGQMYMKGWDIGNHTISHPDVISNLSDSQLLQEYKTNMDWIKNSGWLRAYDHACYPSGQYDERLIKILQGLGVKSGRTTVFGTQPAPVFNIYKLKCIYIGRDSIFDNPTNPSDPNKPYWIKSEIDRAVATGSTLFIMLHRVESDTADLSDPEYGPLAVRESNFRQIVQYVSGLVQQNAIEVDTISEWYADYMK